MEASSSSLEEPLLSSPLPSSNESSPSMTEDNRQSEGENDSHGSHDRHDYSSAPPLNKNVTLPTCACCQDNSSSVSTFQINHNILLNLVLAVLYGISGSLWNGTAYAVYLKLLAHNSNQPVGTIEAVSGVSTLVTALPVGYMADKYGRAKVIRAGGILLLITTILQLSVIRWVDHHHLDDDDSSNSTLSLGVFPMVESLFGETSSPTTSRSFFVGRPTSWDISSLTYDLYHSDTTMSQYDNSTTADKSTHMALIWMGVIMAFWGVGDGVVNGPCAALFADSTPKGERSRYNNYLFACYTIATAVGPLLSIFLFQALGDDWNIKDLTIVLYVGLGMELVNAVLMCLFDDRKALDEALEDDDDSSSDGDDDDDDNEQEVETSPEELAQSNDNDLSSALAKRQRWIPYLVFGQSLIFAIGSGMTVKFFPLFFQDEVGMTPSQVQLIYCIIPFLMVIMSTIAERMSRAGFGRVQTTLLYSIVGVGLLYAMVFCKSFLDSRPFLLVPIYVFRTAFMNATYPLVESILMDFVPKQERARWASLEAVTSAGWCGSAALGGWLADKYDYTYTFFFTAILQTIGTAIWIFLLPLVPRVEGTVRTMEPQAATATAANTRQLEPSPEGDPMQEPLLNSSE